MMNMPNLKKESGFTLIELMVAITIGLLITVVVIQAYVQGLGTQQAQTDLTRVQESSRFAFDLLARSIRKAGYKNPRALGVGFCDTSTDQRLLMTNDSASLSIGGNTYPILNLSDIIRVRYYGEGIGAADGTVVDCLGNAIAANTRVEDTFFVAADPNNNGEPTLYCFAGSSATAQPLIPGIESMQLLYGDDSNTDGTIDQYVPAATVSSPNNVRSVMISVVARTTGATNVDRSARTFNHFGTRYAPANSAPSGDAGSIFASAGDGRTRQHFSTTVALRNLCPN